MSCNNELPRITHTCSVCGKSSNNSVFLGDKEYCVEDARKRLDVIIVTTTPTIEGYSITQYIGIESVEVVIGTGVWSELSSSIQDFFGSRSTEFEEKLSKAKRLTIQKMKYMAAQKEANAVVAMDLDYTEFSGNKIGVIASGTLVNIERIAW